VRARVTRPSPIGKSSPTLDTAGWKIDWDSMVQEVANSAAWDFSRSSSPRVGNEEIDRHEFSFSQTALRLRILARPTDSAHSLRTSRRTLRARRGSPLATTWHRLDLFLFHTSAHVVSSTPLLRARRRGGTRRVTHETRPRTPGTATECLSSPVARRGARPRVSSVARRARASPAFFRRSRVTSLVRGRHGVQLPRGRARAAG
jgi:hypothetical protein